MADIEMIATDVVDWLPSQLERNIDETWIKAVRTQLVG
jgi:hypothetical protein